PADATEEQIMAAIAANAASAAAINQVAAAAGLQTGAEATAICTAVATAVANAARPDPAKFVPIEQVTALQAQVVELQNGSTKDKAETAVNKAIEEGRLAPALRDWALSLHASDAAKFEQFVANAPVVLKPGQQLAGKQP